MTDSSNIQSKVAQKYSPETIKKMKTVCNRDIVFSNLVAERTSVTKVGEWYGVRCEFHNTRTMDAGRLKNYDTTAGHEAVYFCNNPNCSCADEPYLGRLSMFQYWQHAHDFGTEEEAILDLYVNYLGNEMPEPDGQILTEEEMKEFYMIERRRLLFIHTMFFYNMALFKDEGKDGLKYLTEERKIPLEYVKKYYLGYAVGRDSLKNYLLAQGFSLQEIKDAALLSKKENDLYFGRVMVPLFSDKDNVLNPKLEIRKVKVSNFYSRLLNSFIKSDVDKTLKHRYTNRNLPLFNFQEARKKRFAIMPEGCMDTISGQVFIDRLVALEQQGKIPSDISLKPSDIGVFASYGTNGFSEKEHTPQVKKANFEILYIAGDNDANFAGQMANIKRAEQLKRDCPNMQIRIVKWPTNDLNDMLVQGVDPIEMLRVLENAISLEEYKISFALEKSGGKEEIRNQFEAIHRVQLVLKELDLTPDVDDLIHYKRTIQLLSDFIQVDVDTILLHLLLNFYTVQLKTKSEEMEIDLDTLIIMKLSKLKKEFMN